MGVLRIRFVLSSAASVGRLNLLPSSDTRQFSESEERNRQSRALGARMGMPRVERMREYANLADFLFIVFPVGQLMFGGQCGTQVI